MERFRDFFSGGAQAKEARKTIERFGGQRRLSRQNQRRLDEARRISRRHFLKLALGLGGIGTLTSSGIGIGIWKLTDELTEENEDRTLKADGIRQRIRDFEEQHKNEITAENLNQIFDYVQDLYQTVYNQTPIPRQLTIVSNEELIKRGLDPEEDPRGEASGVRFVFYEGYRHYFPDIPLVIFLGEPDNVDPNINKLSVFRALIEHEYIHTQTLALANFDENDNIIPKTVTVGDQIFSYLYTRGTKWVQSPTTEGTERRANQVGYFFDESNTQLLTEFMNDPIGQDHIFHQIINSRAFDKTLDSNFVIGAKYLKLIYTTLGISIRAVKDFHYKANPKGLLEKIDEKFKEKGINFHTLPSKILINLDPNPDSEKELAPLKELVEAVIGQKLEE